jgi:hypothetical protein
MDYGDKMTKLLLSLFALSMFLIGCAGTTPACTETSANVPATLDLQVESQATAELVFDGEIMPADALAAFYQLEAQAEQLLNPDNYSRLLSAVSQELDCYKNFSQELVNGQRSDNYAIYSACTVYIEKYQQVFNEYQASCK